MPLAVLHLGDPRARIEAVKGQSDCSQRWSWQCTARRTRTWCDGTSSQSAKGALETRQFYVLYVVESILAGCSWTVGLMVVVVVVVVVTVEIVSIVILVRAGLSWRLLSLLLNTSNGGRVGAMLAFSLSRHW